MNKVKEAIIKVKSAITYIKLKGKTIDDRTMVKELFNALPIFIQTKACNILGKDKSLLINLNHLF